MLRASRQAVPRKLAMIQRFSAGYWYTIHQLSEYLNLRPTGVAARLRELRNYGYKVQTDNRGSGCFMYKVSKRRSFK